MQWASSTASNWIGDLRRTASRNRGLRNRSGATYNRSSSPARNWPQRVRLLGSRQRTVDVTGPHLPTRQGIDLVLHQGDQRRHDQRYAWPHDRGQLVAETLAAAGGHDAQAILAAQDGINHLALTGTEGRQSESWKGNFWIEEQFAGHSGLLAASGRRTDWEDVLSKESGTEAEQF